jgi:nucleotide-binding universal stress UspA family protein
MEYSGKQYNALTGLELRTTIIREVERSLDNAGINEMAITYPNASWSWTLTLCQRDEQGITSDTPERVIRAGTPTEVIEAAMENDPQLLVKSLMGGSKRFGAQPPSPTTVRKSEDFKIPEA